MRPNKINVHSMRSSSLREQVLGRDGGCAVVVIIKEADPRSQDVWVPSDNFLETTLSSASSLYRWRN